MNVFTTEARGMLARKLGWSFDAKGGFIGLKGKPLSDEEAWGILFTASIDSTKVMPRALKTVFPSAMGESGARATLLAEEAEALRVKIMDTATRLLAAIFRDDASK